MSDATPSATAQGILQKFQLHGKTALVTGSATGLGAAIAIALAQAGAAVACHGNRRAAQDTADTITAAGGHAVALSADLAHTASPEALINHVTEALGQIDILVNNAGTIIRHEAVEFPLDDWMTVLQVNLTSVFQLSQLAAKGMLERGEGKIINIASLLSFQGGIRVPAYAASKGGVAQLTKALANEWAARNVQVNAIAPGYMRTDNTSALQADETRNRQILERIPTGRWGEPEDLAAAAVFLASSASNYITGAILNVDGGWLAR
ncbi:2-dehydro-3-deoxy-D-gluconate 5-dehydrogenase KduD [Terriglobus sp.]|uniref:2-dehydro-3-deoxy-D-gluconate 5-dehydrogenase KduD n=1 Tax=Terriglobus sp. TaxID=1889013 RepID=UPI003B0038E9